MCGCIVGPGLVAEMCGRIVGPGTPVPRYNLLVHTGSQPAPESLLGAVFGDQGRTRTTTEGFRHRRSVMDPLG